MGYKWLQKSDQPTKPAGGKATPAAEGEDGDGESDGWLLPDLKAAASSSFPIGTRVELHSLNNKAGAQRPRRRSDIEALRKRWACRCSPPRRRQWIQFFDEQPPSAMIGGRKCHFFVY